MKTVKKNIFLVSTLFFLFIQFSFASSPPASEIGDWVLENSNYAIDGTTVTVHGNVYVKTTSTITMDTGGNLKIGRFWTKRIPITISTSASPDIPDNYQIWVPTTVFSEAQWSDIKGGTGQDDLDDIRFVSSMNATGYWESCPYWIDPNTTTPRGFWVKISSINHANSNVYMYYGKADAAAASSGSETFEFFDDFDDGDVSDWTIQNIGNTVGSSLYADNTNSISGNYSFRIYTKGNCYSSPYTGGWTKANKTIFFNAGTYNIVINDKEYGNYYAYCASSTRYSYAKFFIDDVEKYSDHCVRTGGCGAMSADWDYSTNGSFDIAASGNTKVSLSARTSDCTWGYAWFDNFGIRKYTPFEPTIIAETTEDTPTTGYYIFVFPQGQIYQKQGSGINK